jgi:hypothetical protein
VVSIVFKRSRLESGIKMICVSIRGKTRSSILKETSANHSADRSGDSGERRKHLKIKDSFVFHRK